MAISLFLVVGTIVSINGIGLNSSQIVLAQQTQPKGKCLMAVKYRTTICVPHFSATGSDFMSPLIRDGHFR